MELAAAIVGVADVAARVGSKLWKLSAAWRDAPDDLCRLRDDLTRTHQFFNEIKEGGLSTFQAALRKQKEPPDGLSDLQTMLGDGLDILQRIEAIIDKLVQVSGQPADSPRDLGKRGKIYWIGVVRKEIATLRKELREVRGAICRLLIAQNAIVSTELQTSINQSREDIKDHVSQTLAITYTHINQSIQASQKHTLVHVDTRMRDLESNLVTKLKRSLTDEFEKQRQLELIITPVKDSTATATVTHSQSSRTLSPLHKASQCGKNCPCPCHKIKTYSWRLGSVKQRPGVPVGAAISLGYQSRAARPCTIAECRNHRPVRTFQDVLAVVYFPDWLARIAISVFVSSNINGGPQLNIRLINRRFVAKSGPLHDVVVGDVERIRHTLREGLASVNDYWDGVGSLLFLAIQTRNMVIVKLLIQAGADPFQLDGPAGVLSPVGSVFHRALANDPFAVEAATLFPISKYVEEIEYSPLHLAVLGFLHIDLGTALHASEYVSYINQLSKDQMTPLHLAASKGDVDATKLLLRFGADPNIIGDFARTPLHLACRHAQDQVVSLLLSAGADPAARDHQGMSPMPYATVYPQRPDGVIRCLSLLLEHGADINCLAGSRSTPLHSCIGQRGSMKVIEFLVRNGTRLNNRDNHGTNVLVQAIVTRRPEVAKFLLDQGVDYKNLSDDGWSFLHYMAKWGDLNTINMFSQWNLRGVNTALKDINGKTALQIFNEQLPSPSPELRKAFDALLDSVEGLGDDNDNEDEHCEDNDWSDGEDIFHDALEAVDDDK
ncbi:hypothetical protein OQA88_2119 [Cercophora sp. LCS_1]